MILNPIDRRTALRNLGLVIGGAILLPACDNQAGKASIALTKLKIDAEQERFLADVCETIIPKTDTPGAKELGLHLFVMKMADDCFSPDDQRAFTSGLKLVSNAAEKQYGKPFGRCTQAQRETFLKAIDNKKIDHKQQQQAKGKTGNALPDDDILAFYNIAKGQTIFGYTYSKYFMTNKVIYELVPGRYNPKYPAAKFMEAPKYG